MLTLLMLLCVYRLLRLNIIMKFINTGMIILLYGCYVWGNSYGCGVNIICTYVNTRSEHCVISTMECSEIEWRSIPVEEYLNCFCDLICFYMILCAPICFLCALIGFLCALTCFYMLIFDLSVLACFKNLCLLVYML